MNNNQVRIDVITPDQNGLSNYDAYNTTCSGANFPFMAISFLLNITGRTR